MLRYLDLPYILSDFGTIKNNCLDQAIRIEIVLLRLGYLMWLTCYGIGCCKISNLMIYLFYLQKM